MLRGAMIKVFLCAAALILSGASCAFPTEEYRRDESAAERDDDAGAEAAPASSSTAPADAGEPDDKKGKPKRQDD